MMNALAPFTIAVDNSIKAFVQAAVLLNHVIHGQFLQHILLKVRTNGVDTIRIALSECVVSEHGRLMRILILALARSMLSYFTTMYSKFEFEESGRCPITADLLELEGI